MCNSQLENTVKRAKSERPGERKGMTKEKGKGKRNNSVKKV